MQLRKLLLPGLLSVTLLSGCSLFNSEEDVVKMSPLPVVENQFTPTTSWSTSVGNGIGKYYSTLHPAFADGVVYAADRHGVVKALSIDDGREIWSVNLAEKDGWFSTRAALLSGGVTVSGGKVYIGTEQAQVYALNASDGSVAWKTGVVGEALSRPVVSDGLVLIHTSNGQLQALNEADGAVKWTVNLDMPSLSLRGESAPTTAFGAAIVGGDNGRVSAVLMQQGQLIWQQRISQANGPTEIDRLSDVDTTPVVVNGVVYALAYNGNMTALDLRSGQIMWKRDLGSVSDFVIDGNRIYIIDQNDRVLALSTDGGVTLWTQSDLLHRNLTSPALYNGYIVTGDSEGYLHWINVEDGRFVAQQKVDSSGFLTEPVVAGGKLLIQAKDGTLYALTR
ncbi:MULTISPECIES: outer membrane protein assembly factor BamB [Kosakonia]|jgi:outer membrane protein assembly factor BamB|uniref:Outer membrane protein assembly factor BamB n=1 Tax=Kosakonia cowanii JCM 10956 = DSM 18146 TaxID=1300165 RepID=A0A807LC47_9ENTR|nr:MULTISPECIES: outer membrane protein assembly factor BamB [Kosakonia]MBS5771960.1 outer membrane protein assembly factor BamB [Enterobacter cloacae]APZ03630.1 outer membrane protein assembly factor BamB [Kosakonia cowanii JCM 10956 = DSM 18146]AST70389.1 outer membrane protein assembly factor BamB [Kosakonia cowanii]AZI86610.1 outer membrane protein assembly factor BamB [Kosakonia sp. CCTCC M2018092]MBK0017362.1 outer membrane protein assembly factor BamB [Kosakonia sp. S42]